MEPINLHYLLLTILCVALNFTGFFPLPDTKHHTVEVKNSTVDPKFDKAVLVVVDALRLDFVSPELMPLLFGSQERDGCFMKLKVEAPTVTLPRIKALVMGNVPTFVDLLLNFGNPGAIHDSLLHHAASQKKTSVFYGDNTWLQIYPEKFFLRSEGTNSFFVHDFKEVDDNVTRNVRLELERHDWDIMILHYLGLDHIGHVHGPRSALIPDKLKEMDGLISEIRSALSARPGEKFLYLITGDHGMKDSGGHGGASYSETHVPFIVLGTTCSDDFFNQVDITANIALLLGLDIPSTSIGLLKRSLLESLTMPEYLQALNYNTRLLLDKAELCREEFTSAEYLHSLYLKTNQTKHATGAINYYDECSKEISQKLTKSSVDQNVHAIAIACLIMLCVLVKIGDARKSTPVEFALMWAVPVLEFFQESFIKNELLSLTLVAVAFLLLLKNVIQIDVRKLNSKLRGNVSFLSVSSIVYPLLLISSSLVEEEHMFWYLFCSTFAVLNLLASKSVRSFVLWLCLISVLRFLRTINQVGDQWADLPDLKGWLLEDRNYVYLHAFFILGLVLTSIALCSLTKRTKAVNVVLDLTVISLIYVFKTTTDQNVTLGKVLWALIFLKLVLYKFGNNRVEVVWILVVALLVKPYNVVLIPACVFANAHFQKSLKNDALVLTHLWMGTLFFFAQGHCNCIASVDVPSGYVGLSSYQPFLVFCQVLSHTYAFPLLSHFLLLRNSNLDKNEFLAIFMTFRIYVMLVVIAVTFHQRQHLFIWSVFAPKLFIESIHLVFQFLVIFTYFFYSRHVNTFLNKLF